MKETYRIPRPPEIACNGDLVAGNNSEELLSVLGFCNSGTRAEAEALKAESHVANAIGSTSSRPDDDDHIYEKAIHLGIGPEELDLRFCVM